VEAFEKVYAGEHPPIAAEKIPGKTKVVLSKLFGGPGGDPPFQRIAEIHYPSMEALNESVASEGTKEAAAHAQSISTGGPIIMMVCEEETMTF
jgi:uncharacterized protein (TIGR02118 family)